MHQPQTPDVDRALATQLVGALAASHRWVATAESCTGGMVAAAITSVPGSSEVFGYGFVTYSYEAKQKLVGVSAWILAEDGPGAVSYECVEAMATGALATSGADLALAVSGIAGPGGGSPEKPVGTVWFAVARQLGDQTFTISELQTFPTDNLSGTALRDHIRQLATTHGLKLLLAAATAT